MRLIPLLTYGLQRTCTNLVKRALCDQAGCYEANGEFGDRGWKHDPIDARRACGPIDGVYPRLVVCFRHPRDWLRSCYQYFAANKGQDHTVCQHFRKRWTFADFVHSSSYSYDSPMDRWNHHTAHNWAVVRDWIHDGRPAAIVRAEDLRTPADQVRVYERLVRVLGLDTDRPLRAIPNRVDNRGRVTARQFDASAYDRFAAAEWTPDLRAAVDQRIDWELADAWEYLP